MSCWICPGRTALYCIWVPPAPVAKVVGWKANCTGCWTCTWKVWPGAYGVAGGQERMVGAGVTGPATVWLTLTGTLEVVRLTGSDFMLRITVLQINTTYD